jgi:hypothetical protein
MELPSPPLVLPWAALSSPEILDMRWRVDSVLVGVLCLPSETEMRFQMLLCVCVWLRVNVFV